MAAAAGGAGDAGAGDRVAWGNPGRLERAREAAPAASGGSAGEAPSALAAGAAASVDVPMRDAEGQPAPRRRRMTGGRITRWCVSAQPKRGKRAHCTRCMEGFAVGEWRVAGC